MIRLSDAATLAYTKLRVHRIRTGIAVAIAALLFGLIGGAIIIAQGIFTSVEDFSQEGLNKRTVLMVTNSSDSLGFNEYDSRADATFIKEIEAAHKAIVDKKKAAAKKYSTAYDAAIEDPSPITIDPATKQKIISDAGLGSQAVQQAAQARRAATYKPFLIDDFVKKYASAKVIQPQKMATPNDGNFIYMKNGNELLTLNERERNGQYSQDNPMLAVLDASLTKPFVVPGKFDASKGEIPVIIPFSAAEKALGLKKLDAKATTNERLERLAYVRQNIDKASASFCYRNPASAALLAKALSQADEIKANAGDKTYVKPKLLYAVPQKSDCGAVVVSSDTRTAAEKKKDQDLELFEKEVGTYLGDPVQKKVTVRGVGVAGDYPEMQAWSLSLMVQALFGSSMGMMWTVPSDLLAQLPADARPDYLFNVDQTANAKTGKAFFIAETYVVEFGDKEQARKVLANNQVEGQAGRVYSMQFGSSTLFVDDAKRVFTEVLKWAMLIIGGIAIIILASIIGRTVAEGRRESAIFRAIGASRGDISAVYGMYVIFLAIQVTIFSAILACAAAAVVQVLYGAEATLGARLAYAASDTTREFRLFDFSSPYLLWIVGVIFAASIIAAILPILLGARRNPIKDMRNE